MIQVFKENRDLKRETTRIVTIRVKDPELKSFLKWISKEKGNLSEFTRQLWKLTVEWDEFLLVKEKFQGEKTAENAKK